MKGVILAGGLGTRLHPLTKITNKHLLPIYDRPMIYYPLTTLVDAGIRDILIVTGGNHAGEFLRLLGNGREFGLEDIAYTYQEGEGGIADALALARHFARSQPKGARLLLKTVPDPGRFGVPVLRDGRIVRVEEKPKKPQSGYAVIGVYMYDATVFDIISTLKPSGRGELEITDVNNAYLDRGELEHDVLEGWWTDAGTFESLFRANQLVREKMIEKLTARIG